MFFPSQFYITSRFTDMFVYKHIPIQMYIKLKPCNYAIIESNIQLKLQIEIKYVRVLIDPNLIFR